MVKRLGRRLQGFTGYANMPRVAVVEHAWSIEYGAMTPTMKLERAHILAQYQQDIERLYTGQVYCARPPT